MDISAYFKELEAHDWFYEWSDDHAVWSKGHEEHKRLKAIANQSPLHDRAYTAFIAYHSSGEAFGSEKMPKPTLADFLSTSTH